MNQKHLSDILETCLGQVLNGQQTIDSVLSRYPDYADELRAELDAVLWLQDRRKLVEMRPGYLAASRKRLVTQISQPVPVKKPVKKPALAWWNQKAFRLSFVALFLFVFVFSAWGGVYAASTALPGDTLHQVKLAAAKLLFEIPEPPKSPRAAKPQGHPFTVKRDDGVQTFGTFQKRSKGVSNQPRQPGIRKTPAQ